MIRRRHLLRLAGARAQAGTPLTELRLDGAYSSPTRLVLKRFGGREEEFRKDGVKVSWTLIAASRRRPRPIA